MDLNIPETRQHLLEARLAEGQPVVAADAAVEFGVSLDTLRRDIIALEQAGKARRVRGGAVPVVAPDLPLVEKLAGGRGPAPALIAAGLAAVAGAKTMILDGGSSVLALARALPPAPGLLVMTPSPWVAAAVAERGIEAFVLGGKLSPHGGIAVGGEALVEAGRLAAEVAVLGACGIDAGFGLSADDFEEAQMKRAMAAAAEEVLVLTSSDKVGRRARYRVLPPEGLTRLITDADAEKTAALAAEGLEVVHA